jgi:two-component system sensor histidine kinase/response regulator
MKVLIVDDIETNRKLLRLNLQAEGVETREAADGVDALAALEVAEVDAVISDILMPRMDGYRLCREIRDRAALRNLPFIFYTSTYTSPGDEQLAIDCGGDRYIRKPAPMHEILSAVRELIDPSRQRPAPITPADESHVMREYSEALVRKLEERNGKLERARAEIAQANAELELRVRERTADLVIANQELEAFSHMIAHDLRSPLAAISGFSFLLLDKCRGKVDDRAMTDLGFISQAAGRMNDMTTDLLRLARANRAEITWQEVNMSALASAVLQDLQAREHERAVTFSVLPGMVKMADFGLIRVALENLLGNAWKYTGKTAHARIEFGREERDGEDSFFVRDNGAGFQMAAAGKLFSTFCRLHPASEFPGTGIGLNTVQRIINRLGGRIWAEAAVGRGATFFFTLGKSKALPAAA